MIKGLPEKLQLLRTRNGLSQKQVAVRLGVSSSIISGYETGERTPSAEMLLAISYLYNCSVDYLLGRQISESSMTINTDGLTEKQLKAIISLIDSIRNN